MTTVKQPPGLTTFATVCASQVLSGTPWKVLAINAVLSTYLGHAYVRDTYWYLSSCPELMEHAARRLDKRWEAGS